MTKFLFAMIFIISSTSLSAFATGADEAIADGIRVNNEYAALCYKHGELAGASIRFLATEKNASVEDKVQWAETVERGSRICGKVMNESDFYGPGAPLFVEFYLKINYCYNAGKRLDQLKTKMKLLSTNKKQINKNAAAIVSLWNQMVQESAYCGAEHGWE